MSDESPVPAIPKIRQRLERLGLSVNAFEREVGLGTGVGSRLLRNEYRPKVAAILRIEVWSEGAVAPVDWLTAEEAARLQEAAAKPASPGAAALWAPSSPSPARASPTSASASPSASVSSPR